MSVRTVVVVALAVICGLSAAAGMTRLRGPATTEAAPETTAVVVAVADISRGRMVCREDLAVRRWPKEVAPQGAVGSLDAAADRVALIPILSGELLLEGKLAARGSGRGLAALIPPGMRAYTIQTSRVASTVAGFILPGNKVDVLLNLRTATFKDDETGGGVTTTLLQSVEILAVDQRLDAPADNKVNPRDLSSVTLLVTPEQAALLDLGQNTGLLTLSLRNPEDRGEADAEPATLADIRFRQERPLHAVTAQHPVEKEKPPETFDLATLRGSEWGHVAVRVRR